MMEYIYAGFVLLIIILISDKYPSVAKAFLWLILLALLISRRSEIFEMLGVRQ